MLKSLPAKSLVKSYRPSLGFSLPMTLLALGPLTLGGCAAGKTADGSVVLGIKTAAIPETASELLHSASNLLPPPWGWITSAAATLLFGGASATVLNQRRAKQREDAAYDEGQARAYAAQRS